MLEINGVLRQVLPLESGQGRNGEWKKQNFVIETMDQYPKSVCITMWGDKIDHLQRFNLGDEIKASINIESREYNGKWYTDVKAWRLEPLNQSSTPPAAGGGQNTPMPEPPPFEETFNLKSDDTEQDDLPF